jgi:hypothetical protein
VEDDFVKMLIDEIFKALEDAAKGRPFLLAAVKVAHKLALSIMSRLVQQISEMPAPVMGAAPKRKR